jgi:pimeloyl-ACP methyl ester carboxylesterase/O-acetyl-ADP-ribose deacetylase (regulator of RNase III)
VGSVPFLRRFAGPGGHALAAQVVFVHGLFSSAPTWDKFILLLAQDPEISSRYDFDAFSYPTPRININPLRQIPSINNAADRLIGYLDEIVVDDRRIVLVTHSQGGLVVQRYLSRILAQGSGESLARIVRVVMFACPNSGSELFLLARTRASRVWRHPQEQDLRPLAVAVAEAQRDVLNRVVHAAKVGPDQCPIPVVAYAGLSDGIVSTVSAVGMFPQSGTLDGDHFSIIQPADRSSGSYRALKKQLLQALVEVIPSRERTEKGLPLHVVTYEPTQFRLPAGGSVTFIVHHGSISELSNIDILVSSENVYMEPAQTFKPTISGTLRRSAAERSPAGEITRDVVAAELIEWLKRHGRYGLPIEAGRVAPTSAGHLSQRGISRLYHAAIDEPRHGTSRYDTNPRSVVNAVRNVFELAREERASTHPELRSICLPLFGAGHGDLSPSDSFLLIWETLVDELAHDHSWEIHFVHRRAEVARFIHGEIRRRADF